MFPQCANVRFVHMFRGQLAGLCTGVISSVQYWGTKPAEVLVLSNSALSIHLLDLCQ